MIRKFLKLTFILTILWAVTACGVDGAVHTDDTALQMQEEATEEPVHEDITEENQELTDEPAQESAVSPKPAEPVPELPPPLVTEEGIVWIVPPTLEHDRISSCGQCGFIDSQRRAICTVTGVSLDRWGGHGMGSLHPEFVYDPNLNMFGEPLVGGGYGRGNVGMHPFEEALFWFALSELSVHYEGFGLLRGLNIVQAVDSTKWYLWDWISLQWQQNHSSESLHLHDGFLADDAFLGKFAVMYNGEFVTDFIFDGGVCPGGIHNWAGIYPGYFNAVAMSMDGKWGTVDRYGNTVAPFIFDRIAYFDQGRAVAVYDGRYGLIDRYGNILVPFIFDDIYRFGESFNHYRIAAVYNGNHGIIDETGNIVIPFFFDHLYNINCHTAFAMYNGRYGIIDMHKTQANTSSYQR